MYKSKKVVVVLPAYNAEKTLEKTFIEIPMNLVDEVILVDDNSIDETSSVITEVSTFLTDLNKDNDETK
jgi:glycosyltransferase involved in cell wall biosynthesis